MTSNALAATAARAAGSVAKRVSTPAPPFRGLEQQDGLAVVARGQRFGHQLALFELVHRFDAALQRVLKRRQRLGRELAQPLMRTHDEMFRRSST